MIRGGRIMKKIKKLVSVLLVLAMTITLIPANVKTSQVEVNAATTDIVSGKTYKIVSAYNGKAITQTDWSTFYADCVVWNTNAMSDFARWTVNASGDYYTFTNVVTSKSIKITGKNNGDKLDLNGNDNTNNYKWKLVPITSGDYAGCFYIVSAVQNGSGEDVYAEIISDENKRDTDGAQVRLWTKAKSPEYEPRQIWKFEQSDAENITFTEEMNDTLVNAFKNKYFVKNKTTGYNSLGGGFWGIAEVMEAMLDGYETTGKAVYKEMFEGTYNDFIARNSDDWSGNEYNDDVAWAVLDSVRAYLMFGNSKYLDIAKKNYDMMYARGLRDDGLIIWKMNTDGGTTSCINGPATVAACYLAIATGDDSYYKKAKNIYSAWSNSKLYVKEGDDAGHVWDSSGNAWCSTYNQGTFIGASTMLYEKYGDEQYKTNAKNAVRAVYRYLCNGNILKEENTNSGDLSGMRGILMRYMRKYIVTFNSQDDLDFFHDNAKVAWMNRNSSNIMQCSWQKKTSEDVTWDSFAAYNAISLMANIPTYSDTLERDAYSTIEAEDMDYTKGLISEGQGGASGGRGLGGVKSGCYTVYNNVNFGTTGASKIKLRYSRSPESDGAKGTVEIRLGSLTGPTIASIQLENTASWQDWKEVTVDIARTTGLQNLYVKYSADTSHVINFDYFTFEKATDDNQGYMFLKSESVDKYASAEDGSNNTTVLAKSYVRETWEGYRVEKNDDGTVCLRSYISGKLVRAAAGGNGYYITANADSVADDTKFIIERYSANTSAKQQVAIKSVLTGKYLMVDPSDSKGYLLANSETVGGAWETFHFETANGEWVVPKGSTLISTAYIDAYSEITATDYSSTGGTDASEPGVKKDTDSDGNPTNVGGVENGDWIAYDYIKFGDTSPATFELSFASHSDSCKGYVEVYIDSMDSTPVTKINLNNTDNSWNNYVAVEGKINGNITGTHTVYMKFTTEDSKKHVANLKWFKFNKESGIRDAFSNIEAEEVDAHETTKIYGAEGDYVNGYLGETNMDSWARYDSIYFSKTAKSLIMRYSAKSSNARGKIAVYLDSFKNNPVCELNVTATGSDWADYVETQVTLNSDITEGIHSVYLKFTPDTASDSNIIHVANVDRFSFTADTIRTSSDVKVEGYQVSATLGGSRVIASVEPSIGGVEVTGWGLVYGLATANGQDMGITDSDMYVGSTNKYVASFQSTSEGTMNIQVGSSTTATYYVRTMLFGSYTAAEFNAQYKVRAYAILADGSYVYGKVVNYAIYDVADGLYQNRLMNSLEAHNFLYNKVLTVVNPDYKEVDYNWGSTVVKPGTME